MEMFTLTSIVQLQKRGMHVEFFCPENSHLHKNALRLKIPVHTTKKTGYIQPREIAVLARVLKKGSFDVVHTQASKDLWILVPALRLAKSRIPLILTKQVGSYIAKKDLLHRLLYSRVTLIFAISMVIKQNLLDTCPVEEKKIKILHNGIDFSRFDPKNADREAVRAEYGVQPDETVLGMMARLSPGKGHEEFLSAAKRLNKEFRHLKFLVVGAASEGEDAYAESIYRLASSLQLKNVIFAGFRKDTERVLSAMDIFVFPSHSEALGIALIEAMAMEKASVCSNSDGVLDLAFDHQNALLFQKKDDKDLAEKCRTLILSEESRVLLGTAARNFVRRNLDIELLTDRTIAYYHEAMDSVSVNKKGG